MLLTCCPVIDIEKTFHESCVYVSPNSGRRRGQTVKIHEPSRGREKKDPAILIHARSLSHAAHMQIYAVAPSRVVRGSLYRRFFPPPLLVQGRSCCTLHRIRNVTATENYIPRILNLKRSTRSRQKRRGDFADRFLGEFVRLRRMRRPFEKYAENLRRDVRYVDSLARCSSSALYNS